MLKISIVQVDNPSCIWGRVVQGPGGDAVTAGQYETLQVQMNLFYSNVTQDLQKLKLTSIEKGQVCVVYWSVMKSWCRAVVESVIMDSVSRQARCLLVDHREQLVVPLDQIRVAVQTFFQLPFWVRRFHLARIKPSTLRVSLCERAELIPSSRWDSSATLYLHNLLQASTQAEAVLLRSESDSHAIELYLTVRNIKICVNDDLVMKKFAFYIRESADGSPLDEVDRFPVMLPSSILNQSSPPRSVCRAEHTQPSPVMSHRVDAGRAGDWLTAPSVSQRLHERTTPEEAEELRVPQITPEAAAAAAAAAESDSSEETDSSLASALTKNLSLYRVSRSMESGAADKTLRREEDWACSRLLEWLNPEPLNSDPDAADDETVPNVPRSGILVHSALPVVPCSCLDDAPITNTICRVLQRKQYNSLSPADRYSWPSVARGNNTVIVSPNADQPLSYLAPLLTHIELNSIFTPLNSSTGPIAVLLCPGWEKVQAVYDLLKETMVAKTLHPAIVLLGVGKDEAKAVKIPKNCLLLVTTPFSLVRLLSCHCFLFLRLYHLVLDEADLLFTLAPDQMATILQHFQEVTSSKLNASCPQQLIAVSKRWTGHMEGLLANHMPHPCVVMTVLEEAALYGDVQQIILMTPECSKISVLLGALDLNPDVGQKTLIVANSAQEVEDVFKAVTNKSAFCLRTHEGLTHMFDFVIQQWRKDVGPRTHVVLVTTNECLKSLGIRDATCVVHYSFPTSPKVFGGRLFCMVDNFRNLSERVSSLNQSKSSPPLSRSVLLISERNARHVVGILRYLARTNAPLPPELLSFARGVLVAREDQRTNRPLCRYIKSFGVCRDSRVCPDRHRFIPTLDQSVLPASGVVEVMPLYIKTASVFYGYIIRKEEGGFQSLMSEMTSYYADKKPGVKELLEGGLYAVEEDKMIHRVKILSVPDRTDRLFFSVFVRFIDVGKEVEVKSYQILQLPEQFQSLPGQAVEIIVCRVKPVDEEADWHPKVTRAISQKIRGLQHRARAVFSLGNTVFVDPMVRVTQVPGMKAVINEYNLQSEIFNTGMGVSNPEHLDLLRVLCQESKTGNCKEAGHMSGARDGPESLEVRIKAEEEVLAEAFRAEEVSGLSDLPPLEPCEPPNREIQYLIPTPPVAEPNPALVCDQTPLMGHREADGQRKTHRPDLRAAEQMMRIRDGPELNLTASQPALLNAGGTARDNVSSSRQVVSSNETNCDDSTKSFHPQVRWFQTPDSVTVTVKLTNPESQRCEFLPDGVVYSGRVNGRSYRVDLELHANIAADLCCWEMKSNEPVLKLIKQQRGVWEKLLKNKSVFVSYDLEHIEEKEEKEDRIPNGVRFLENTGEGGWYLNLESDSESD